VLFGSGYLANLGAICALAGRGGRIFSDELNHASIIDGCRLSRAEVFIYRHCDVEHLAWGLAQAEGRGALIVTDSVFSMGGDIAPLEQIVMLAERDQVRVMVDEAHGTGALGPDGRGALAAAGLENHVDVIVGTLGKALGSYGAYVACDRTMSTYLVNAARTFIFSTALPPPAAAGALAALEILEEEPRRVERLATNAAAFRSAAEREGFDLQGSCTQIVPLVIGDADLAVRICEGALARGVFAQAIRPPTVPAGTSRLRVTVMASHRAEELSAAARTLAQVARAEGFEPRAAPLAGGTFTPVAVEGREWASAPGWDEDEVAWADPDDPEPMIPFPAAPKAAARLFDGESEAATRPFDHEAPAPTARAA
jgi:glycine C-acetyltransferase/8-amino-7-oxononanoate synthase